MQTLYAKLFVTLMVPEGSVCLEGENEDKIRLPDGKIVSVVPIVEMESSLGADDHLNLNHDAANEIGVNYEYNRYLSDDIEE